jgi:hypothetical protein
MVYDMIDDLKEYAEFEATTKVETVKRICRGTRVHTNINACLA